MSNVAADSGERDRAAIATDEQLPVAPGASALDRWVEQDVEGALAKIEARNRILEALRKSSILATYASDWIIHTATDSSGEVLRQVGYLQDCGADRAGKPWGIQIEAPASVREDLPDGTFAYKMRADAFSRVTGERIENVLGSRWSGDSFFTPRKEGERVDPTDVEKAAYANLHGRAVRAIAGLGGVPLEHLLACGLKRDELVFVGYSKGAKGGTSAGASTGTAEFVIRFGNCKGKRPAEIGEKDLDWYIARAEEAIADPSKANYRRHNERELGVFKAERERRANAKQQAAETGTEEAPSKGKRLADFHARLLVVLNKRQAAVPALLRAITDPPVEQLSDLSDEQIEWLETLPEEELKAKAEEVLRAAGKK